MTCALDNVTRLETPDNELVVEMGDKNGTWMTRTSKVKSEHSKYYKLFFSSC